MSASTDKQAGFLGTYFDRDGVLRLSRWADIIAWIVLTIYLLAWLFSIILFFAQYANGLYFDKGMTLINVLICSRPTCNNPCRVYFIFLVCRRSPRDC